MWGWVKISSSQNTPALTTEDAIHAMFLAKVSTVASQTWAGCTTDLAIFSHVHPLRNIWSLAIHRRHVYMLRRTWIHPRLLYRIQTNMIMKKQIKQNEKKSSIERCCETTDQILNQDFKLFNIQSLCFCTFCSFNVSIIINRFFF